MVVVVWNESHRKVLTLNASNVTQHLRRSHQLDALSNILSTSTHNIWWWGSLPFNIWITYVDFVKWQLLILYSSLYCQTMSESMRQSISPGYDWITVITCNTSALIFCAHSGRAGRMEVDCFIMFVQSFFMPSTPPSMNAIRKWCLDGFSVLAYQLQESEELSFLSLYHLEKDDVPQYFVHRIIDYCNRPSTNMNRVKNTYGIVENI